MNIPPPAQIDVHDQYRVNAASAGHSDGSLRTTAARVQTSFAALRQIIQSPHLEFLMEAHNGLSARIVEEAGFRGIWASGLTISTSLGLRDSNEASWTQVLEILEYMTDATRLPILVDGDTGHGNFNNVRRFVRKLCERGVAGICIEDKLFPKTNSFVGERQPLAEIDEFCGRIKAGKDSQTDDDFVFVARVEALISGRGMEEALRRAEAYHAAGADAILIHSKQRTAGEVMSFAKEWAGRSPLIIVPTKYYATPTDQFREAKISTVIWANHLLRAAVSAMKLTATNIGANETLVQIEDRIAPVDELFRLSRNDELDAAERRYLPAKAAPQAIVLAATRGEILELTEDRPKCLLDVRGVPLLSRLVSTLQDAGLSKVAVVRGYRKNSIDDRRIVTVDNDRYAQTDEVFSLACTRSHLMGETVVMYGDVLFRRYILDAVLNCDADIVIAVDGLSRPVHSITRKRDYVAADLPYVATDLDDSFVTLKQIDSGLPRSQITGEWIGLARFSATGTRWLCEELDRVENEGLLEEADMALLLSRLAKYRSVRVLYFASDWVDVNTLIDLADARNFV